MAAQGLLRIYENEYVRLQRVVRRMTGSVEAAEDIVHDTFLKLNGRDIGSGDVGLLVRTAQNLARDVLRSQQVRHAYAASMTAEQIAPRTATPDEEVAGKQELNDLLNALKSLPRRTQQVFLLSKLDEMTYPQIAEKLGVSVSTVEKDMISALDFCRAWRRRRDFF